MDETKSPTIVEGRGARGKPRDPVQRYKLGAVLGRGGMGEVTSAIDEQIGRAVAVKRLRGDQASNQAAVARFLREGHIQARLEHPAIVPVHEVSYDDNGEPYFVMKQLTGVTLSDVLKESDEQRFPRQKLLRAFVDVCLAIEFAHTRGVLHRDLKPSNVMLGDFGETYVLDWGIARVSKDDPERDETPAPDVSFVETAAGAVLGTPGYIAPEQIRGQTDIDARTDVYSLGCILFEILARTRFLPVRHDQVAQGLVAHDARPSVRVPDRDIPPELDAICVRATALERADRFATARELGDAVQRFLDGDRDLALRKTLAAGEIDSANAAIARGDVEGRRDAIRHAARALALDPSARDAAQLVGRLMLEPPVETPPEVVDVLAQRDVEDMRAAGPFGMLAAAAYVLFLPLMFWAGMREVWLFTGIPALVATIFYSELVILRRDPLLAGRITVTCHLALIACAAFAVSPFLIGPAPACIVVLIVAAQPYLIRTWVVAVLAMAVTIAPVGASALGLIPQQLASDGTHLILHVANGTLDWTGSIVALLLYAIAVIAIVMVIGRSQDDDRRIARRTLEVQAWKLRQLLPRPG
jgi:serine/threonine-protein kinase